MGATTRLVPFLICFSAAAVAFAGGDEDQPARHFLAKTTAGEVDDENVRGKVVLVEVWDYLAAYGQQEEKLVDPTVAQGRRIGFEQQCSLRVALSPIAAHHSLLVRSVRSSPEKAEQAVHLS